MQWWRKRTGCHFFFCFSINKYHSCSFLQKIFNGFKAKLIFFKLKYNNNGFMNFPQEFLKLLTKSIILKKRKKLNVSHNNEFLLTKLKKNDLNDNNYYNLFTGKENQNKRYSIVDFYSYCSIYNDINYFKQKFLWIGLVFSVIHKSFLKENKIKKKNKKFFVSKKIIFKLIKNGKMKSRQLLNKFVKHIFSWLTKNWNQKRFFAFYIFEKFLQNNYEETKIQKKKSGNIHLLDKKFTRFIRDNHSSPSSLRSLKLCIIKLTNFSRDFCLKIRKKTHFNLKNLLIRFQYSKELFLFIFQKIKKFLCEKGLLFFKKLMKTGLKDNKILKTENSFINKINWNYTNKISVNRSSNYKYQEKINSSFFSSGVIKRNLKNRTNKMNKNKLLIKISEILMPRIFRLDILKYFNHVYFRKGKFTKKIFLKFFLKLIIFQKKNKTITDELNGFLISILSELSIKNFRMKTNRIPSLFLNLSENDQKSLNSNIKKYSIIKDIWNLDSNLNYILKKARSKKNFLRAHSYFLSYGKFSIFSSKINFFLFLLLKKENKYDSIYSIPEVSSVLGTIFKIKKENILKKENIIFTKNHWIFLILSRILIQNSKNEIKMWYSVWEFLLFFLDEFSIYPFAFLSRILDILSFKIKNSSGSEKKLFKNRFLLLLSFSSVFKNGIILYSRFNLEVPKKLLKENKIIYYKKKKKIKFLKKKSKGLENAEFFQNFINKIAKNCEKGHNYENFHLFSAFLRILCFPEKLTKKFFKFLLYYICKFFKSEILSEYLIFLIDSWKNSPQLLQENFKDLTTIFSKKPEKIVGSFIVFFEEIFKKGIVKTKHEFWIFIFQSPNKNLNIYKKKKKILQNVLNGSIVAKSNFFIDFVPFLISSSGISETFFLSILNLFLDFFNKIDKKIILVKKIILWGKIYNENTKMRKFIKFLTQINMTPKEWTLFLSNINTILFVCQDKKIKIDILIMFIKKNIKKKKDDSYIKMLEKILDF